MTSDTQLSAVPDEFEGTDVPEAPLEASAPYHSILEVWRASLAPVIDSPEKPTLVESATMVSSYANLTFGLAEVAYGLVRAHLTRILNLVNEAIEENEGCLDVQSPAEDREENGEIYVGLVKEFQRLLAEIDFSFDCNHPFAAAISAAFYQIHHMLMSSDAGMVRFLDNIQLIFTEEAQREVADMLQEIRDASLAENPGGSDE